MAMQSLSFKSSMPAVVWQKDLALLDADKREIQQQWDQSPCGAESVEGIPRETLEYFRAIRDYRYGQYAPWMERVIGFSEWKHKDILEIGVGLGSDHYRFASHGNRMTALDLSREHLRLTEQHLTLEKFSTDLHYGDAEHMPFANASFDMVYTFGVIHHTPNTEAAVAEIHRVLRPGGTAIIGLYHRDSWAFWVSTLLIQGIVKLGLFRKGWRGLLSEIEQRSNDNQARPLVKVYSRKQAKQLAGAFSRVDIQTAHVEASHLSRFGVMLKNMHRSELERRFAQFGWYVVLKATK